MKHSNHRHAGAEDKPMHHYRKLMLMTALSFIAMYILMYAMVDVFANVVHNVNQIYMAGLMATPMVIIELLVMGGMYNNKKRNAIIIAVSALALAGFFLLIRQQGGVSDRQFLKSMIPHHASAILMSEEADLNDPEVRALARQIIESQQEEIRQMKAKLEAMDADSKK
ncbi:DUF305 domain-containing protein [Flavobacterium sp. MFBS3-15]|uniref:DUF305 domain-containing protein n=1 Tax=Flavobacterium sp. MFBS3-15 TaxID=2989816 RepID=UPI0022368DD3|nr:DUF305 domain-containing protein [Flavobacterium sp. MFBS3-15]MCW4469796.1 DUF305 domain-containing protein [Flavobacterium sp. MFBS3-15]